MANKPNAALSDPSATEKAFVVCKYLFSSLILLKFSSSSEEEEEEENSLSVFPFPKRTRPSICLTRFFIEELDFDLYVDCATKYTGAATDNLTGLSRFDGMAVQSQGNGYGFYNTVSSGVFNFTAHGQPADVQTAQIGFGIDVKIEPMPLSIITGQNAKTSSLTQPKHIRSVTFMFDDVVGGTVNDNPISIGKFSEVAFGSPPIPMNGLFELSIMKGWDDFNNPSFTIEHNEPFNIRLLGLSYKVEV